MKNRNIKCAILVVVTTMILAIFTGCERDLNELEEATYPKMAEVFIDGFSPGLEYEAWGDVTAFDVDKNVSYEGTASMRFAVPNEGETGGYAGGRFVTSMPRDLTGYDALTFWVKASKPATLDEIGFGNNAQGSKFQTGLYGLKINTNWKKAIIPIPDASRLTAESGMMFYAESPEEGSGYTFWIDEVQFEKLGTIAHKKPMILNGKDEVETAVNGLSIPISGMSISFNMPDGIDQSVVAAPAYYSFVSSDTTVAKVNETGMVSVLNAGTAVITASVGGVNAEGSLTVESSGEFTNAPAPTADSAGVISIFSDAYANVPVDFYNGYWEPYQTTVSADFTVRDDHVLYYTSFNFVGIQFTDPPVNGTTMTHLHMDVWIPNEVNGSERLNIKVVDMGPDGALDGNDPTISYELPGPLASQSWISVDIPLSGLSSKSRLAQIIFEGLDSPLSGFYLDNVYFYNDDGGGTPTGPTNGAPDPPARDPGDVISIYGDSYTNLEGTDYPDWGGGTVVSDVVVGGKNTLKFASLGYQGIQLASAQDVSGMESLHLDFWTANSTSLNVYLISTGPVESAYTLTVPTSGWTSIDIPLTSFTGVDLADVIQMKFDGNGDIWLDNIYFFTDGGGGGETEPSAAAPSPPARNAADVISIYGDAYTNLAGTDYPDWGGGTVVSDVSIAGNQTLKFTGLGFQGIQLASAQDLSGMESLHLDFWTANSTKLDVYLISPGPTETAYELTVPTSGWTSIDIPLTSFTGVDLADVIQMKFDGNGDIWLDNIYFFKDGGGGGDPGPTAAAPTPPARNAADVISFFSNAYTDVTVDSWSAVWDDSDVADVQVEGDEVKRYTFTNFAGIDFSNHKLDASGMTNFHMDIWTPDVVEPGKVLTIKWVDFGGGGAEVSNFILTVVHTVSGSIPALETGTWISIDVPISEFTGTLTRTDLAQLVLTCNLNTVYVDNIYLYK